MSYPQNRTKSLESEGQKNSPQVLYNPGNDNHTVRCLFWGKFDSEKKKTVENWSFHMLCSSRLWECNVFHPALVLHIKSEKSIVCKCYYNFVNFWMVKDTWLIAHHWFYLNYLTLLWSPSFYVYLNRLFIDYRSLTAFRVSRSSENSKVSLISPLEVQCKICLAQDQPIGELGVLSNIYKDLGQRKAKKYNGPLEWSISTKWRKCNACRVSSVHLHINFTSLYFWNIFCSKKFFQSFKRFDSLLPSLLRRKRGKTC